MGCMLRPCLCRMKSVDGILMNMRTESWQYGNILWYGSCRLGSYKLDRKNGKHPTKLNKVMKTRFSRPNCTKSYKIKYFRMYVFPFIYFDINYVIRKKYEIVPVTVQHDMYVFWKLEIKSHKLWMSVAMRVRVRFTHQSTSSSGENVRAGSRGGLKLGRQCAREEKRFVFSDS